MPALAARVPAALRAPWLWLQVVSLLHVVLGVATPWLVRSERFATYLEAVLAGFGAPAPDAAQRALLQWLYILLGAMVAGWGVLMAGLVHLAAIRRDRLPLHVLLVALLGWAALDMGWALARGVTSHLVVDLAALLALVPALLLLRRRITPLR